ncbi:hypothetical protein [Gorillibacterium timonense]|uniref:hypothetical protein n=1 Tax=Gorillibacterium timonense TaxID=1689269 RepID=UPI000AC869CB|nr:hypothetical protein [Gorillibacterium timonense]
MTDLEYTAAQRRHELAVKFFPAGLMPDQIKLLDEVEQLLIRAYQAGESQAVEVQTWSNQSAFGYAILAAERTGQAPAQIQQLVKALHTIFDRVSLEEAAAHYRRSPY